MKLNILKFFYRSFLTGMPILTYNPFNLNTFNAPMVVEPYSAYINFKLNDSHIDYLKDYIKEYSNLTLIPIKMFSNSDDEYIMSLNIYNCTSPVFLNKEKVTTRCEINTYVKDENGKNGTLIIDYLSNDYSVDPVNIFKPPDEIIYDKINIYNFLNCTSIRENINLVYWLSNHDGRKSSISNKLIKYTDKVYYKNGIYDKVYYDSSLVNADIRIPYSYSGYFKFKNITFDEPHSVFYFKDKINFIGGIWANLFDLK